MTTRRRWAAWKTGFDDPDDYRPLIENGSLTIIPG